MTLLDDVSCCIWSGSSPLTWGKYDHIWHLQSDGFLLFFFCFCFLFFWFFFVVVFLFCFFFFLRGWGWGGGGVVHILQQVHKFDHYLVEVPRKTTFWETCGNYGRIKVVGWSSFKRETRNNVLSISLSNLKPIHVASSVTENVHILRRQFAWSLRSYF